MKYKSLIILGMGLLISVHAFSNEFAVHLGVRSDSAKTPLSGVSLGTKTNYQLGALMYLELSPTIYVRSGFSYVKRSYTLESSNGNGEFNFTNFDIPVGLMLKFTDYAGVFGGALVSLNSGSDCSFGSNCKPANVTSTPAGFQLGVHFKFASQLGGEIYYESLSGKLADGIENASAIVGNFIITFD